MQTAAINMPEQMLAAIQAHLFQAGIHVEQGGFLLCAPPVDATSYNLQALEWLPLQRQDYVVQASDYLELTDAARIRIIKTAHDRNAVLVEVHCHPGNYPACFSLADIVGLAEFVPHIRWRLKGKPYAALVFAKSGVDGLAWFGASKVAMPVQCIVAGSQRVETTRLTGKVHGEIHYG